MSKWNGDESNRHALTPEDRAKGTQKAKENREKKRAIKEMNLKELLAAEIERRADEIAEVFFKAVNSGDWKAAEALLNRVYGRPKETVETIEKTNWDEWSPDEIEALKKRARETLN